MGGEGLEEIAFVIDDWISGLLAHFEIEFVIKKFNINNFLEGF